MKIRFLLLSSILALALAPAMPRAGVILLAATSLLLGSPAVAAEADVEDEVNKLPLNTAEVVLEIGKSEFEGEALTPHTTFTNAYYVEFSATDSLKEKARCRIHKRFRSLSCDGYDTLIFFVKQDFRAQRVIMEVTTNAGTFENTAVSEPLNKSKSAFSYMELPVHLDESTKIEEIAITEE